MSHFLDRLRYFTAPRPQFSDGHGAVADEDPAMGGRLPQTLAARQDSSFHSWSELHGVLLMEDLCEGRHRHVGNAADGLGGFLLPIIFGILLDFFRVRSTCFMFLYGIVWVSLILIYLSEVRRTPVAGSVA
ncbi:hypothetical protein QF001_004489 [Paraburkholderia youngii]